jgi:hypothetical protein
MLLTDMVKHLGISVSGVGYAVEMGEAIERDKIITWLIAFLVS